MQGTGMGMAVGEDPIRQRLLAAQREENVKLRHNNFELNAKLNEAVAREAKLAAQLDEARASRDDAVARLATSDAELSRLRDELALSRTTPPATGG
jgi:predicted nuclease with TOPRIM domain